MKSVPRLEPGIAVRHIDGRTGQLLEIGGTPDLPLGRVRFQGVELILPLGYLERIGSKDMD